MLFWGRKVKVQPGHSDEWNDGYYNGHKAAWSELSDSMRQSIEFHNAYAQMLERELTHLREELKKYRQGNSEDGGNSRNDS